MSDLAASGCYRSRQDGLDLLIRLTPRSSADAIDGVGGSADGSLHLAVRVHAVPENGAANAALERLLAEKLQLPKRAIKVVAGLKSRLKTVRLSGDPVALAKAIEEALAASGKVR